MEGIKVTIMTFFIFFSSNRGTRFTQHLSNGCGNVITCKMGPPSKQWWQFYYKLLSRDRSWQPWSDKKWYHPAAFNESRDCKATKEHQLHCEGVCGEYSVLWQSGRNFHKNEVCWWVSVGMNVVFIIWLALCMC